MTDPEDDDEIEGAMLKAAAGEQTVEVRQLQRCRNLPQAGSKETRQDDGITTTGRRRGKQGPSQAWAQRAARTKNGAHPDEAMTRSHGRRSTWHGRQAQEARQLAEPPEASCRGEGADSWQAGIQADQQKAQARAPLVQPLQSPTTTSEMY